MDAGADDQRKEEPAYPDGIPNFNRFGMLSFGVALSPSAPNAEETIRAVGEALNRPAHHVDQDGYEHEITAGAVHPGHGSVAWVEYRCKKLDNGHVDIEFSVKAQAGGRIVIDWLVETYNPFFGCRVDYMAWHGDRVVIVYREKHHTYACSLGVDGTRQVIQIADQWLAVGDQLTFRSEEPDFVERLAFPELQRLDPVPADEVRQAGMLPRDYDHWNEWNKKHLQMKPKKRGQK
jgi:hypothetical protein